MSDFKEYDQIDAVGLAELVSKGEVTQTELLEKAISVAEQVNPKINAIVTKCYDAARESAKSPLPDSPIAGVPFLIKDLTAMKGLPCTSGSRLMSDYTPDHDAEIVARYRRAGLNLFGKTNTPEFGLTVTTEPVLFGPARNPWNTEHSTGGSSGGAAAAVAAGIVPAAHASDGGGSIRIPAACCGLVGLKPTRARNPSGPDAGEGWSGMSISHVVSRSIRDSAAFLDATHGPDLGDPYYAPRVDGSFLEACHQHPGKLRIAYSTTAPTGVEADQACIDAVETAAKLCQDLGHEVEEAHPEADYEAMGNATYIIITANTANTVDTYAQNEGIILDESNLETITLLMAEMGRSATAGMYAGALLTMHRVSRQIAAFYGTYDVLITPTLLKPPAPLGWLDMNSPDAERYQECMGAYFGFTALYNATGQPSMSLPLHWGSNNLPIGTLFTGRMGEESLLLQLGHQLEQAAPWFDLRPNLPT
jgi:Asp-tRNA(Asn)/Glu-tRNA(Gln) amidotransferase A subunit family amidase